MIQVSIGAINTTNAKTDVQAAIAMPQQGLSTEGRTQPDQVENLRTAENERMKQMVQEMQIHIDSMNVSLEFSTYGDNGNKIAVIVSDKDTGEVIREIPSKELRNLYAKMREINGIIFNTQA